MRRLNVELYDKRERRSFRVQLIFDGPDGSAETQRARGQTAKALCPPDQLRSGPLDKACDAETTRTCLLRATVADNDPDAKNWPAPLRQYVFRGGRPSMRRETPIGFFIVDMRQPTVLSYICVVDEASRLKIGALLYQHYENWLVRQHPLERQNVFLAALADTNDAGRRPVVEFYESVGFRAATQDDVVYDCTDIEIAVPPDTLLMVKSVGVDEVPVKRQRRVEPFATDLTASGDVDLIDVERVPSTNRQ